MSPVIARFTPGIMPPEILEAIFVARQPLLDALVSRAEEAATSANRHHMLIVGPRGSGKTHLLTMAYHRVQNSIEHGERLQAVRLPEDPWTIVSYRHLLQAISSPLGSDAASEEDCEAWLIASASDNGPVVVFVENLDLILTQIGVLGQEKLRHFLQTSDALLLLASTTTLDRNLATTSKPFYNFFTTARLTPLSVEDARQMLKAISTVRGDNDELESYLDTPQATARLKTIALIAGSQPRVWASLANVMTVDSLGSLADLLTSAFDDLVPYYQEQMASLSPQQRLVVAELARTDHPLHVADLAERLGMEPKSTARAVGQLKNMHWLSEVRPGFDRPADRRRTYYELAEPMARFSLQIKESCGQPVPAIVDFLVLWFSFDQLDHPPGQGEYPSAAHDRMNEDPRLAFVKAQEHRGFTRFNDHLKILGELDDALASLLHPIEGDLYMSLPTVLRVALEEWSDECEPSSWPRDLRVRADLRIQASLIIRDSGLGGWFEGMAPIQMIDQWVDRSLRLDADIAQALGGPIEPLDTIDFLEYANRRDEAELLRHTL